MPIVKKSKKGERKITTICRNGSMVIGGVVGLLLFLLYSRDGYGYLWLLVFLIRYQRDKIGVSFYSGTLFLNLEGVDAYLLV